MRKLLFIGLLALWSIVTFGQEITGDLEVYLNDVIANLPGSDNNNFTAPSEYELVIWSSCINAVIQGDPASAREYAAALNYDVIEYTDHTLERNNVFYVLAEKSNRTKYWGTYVFSKDPLRKKLIIQIPHPVHDSNTGYQGIYCFKRLSAGGLFISGTHRCNSTGFSLCSGTTSACGGGSTPYRKSDNAHIVHSVFQTSTEILLQEYEQSVFLQLHGFTKGDDDPYVIMSNGTRVTPQMDYLSLLRDRLWIIDPGLTFKIAHIDKDWDRLIAFTNIQGRMINQSSDPCSRSATYSEGRFLHIEQERVRLRSSASAWDKMSLALSQVFEVDTMTTHAIPPAAQSMFTIYPNPASDLLHIEARHPYTCSLYNLNGELLLTKVINEPEAAIDLNGIESGIYFIKIQHNKEVVVRKIIRL